MKRIIILLLILLLAGCGTSAPEAHNEFKEAYESLNDVQRVVEIDANNPFVYASMEGVLAKVKKGANIYVYFGDEMCPWCRSNIETAIKIAKENNIKTIYYVEAWDKDHSENYRDKYEMIDGELVKTKEGSEEYYEFLKLLDDYLEEYKFSEPDVSTGEKRIYIPLYVHFSKGTPDRATTGTAPDQEKANEELTYKTLKEQEEQFRAFFVKEEIICQDEGC